MHSTQKEKNGSKSINYTVMSEYSAERGYTGRDRGRQLFRERSPAIQIFLLKVLWCVMDYLSWLEDVSRRGNILIGLGSLLGKRTTKWSPSVLLALE